jgi:phenylacetate-CoA ligase
LAIDFSLRDFFDPLAILQMRRNLARTQWMSEERLRAYQDERLRHIVRHAARHVPYYRRLFLERGVRVEDLNSADDLDRLPRLSRETVRQGGALFHADHKERYRRTLARTSGSSGLALDCYLDRESNALEFVHYWRHWGWAGYRLGQQFAELASIHFLRRPQLDGRIFDVQRVYGRLLLNSMKLTRGNLGEYRALLARFRPLYLKGLPSALYHLATLLAAAKAAIAPLRAVFSSGENVTCEMRAAIESTFQCPLLDCYGHMERTACIAQCPEGTYHVLSDYGLLELADRRPSGEPGIELATAVGTTLYNRAMPLLRYEIGDLIEVFQHPPQCRCGRSFPVVRGVRGRTAAAIVTPEGRVESALFALPSIVPGVAFLQFVQQRPDRVEVKVVRTEAFNGGCDAILWRCLSEALGPSMEIRISYASWEEIEQEPSGKRPVAISAVPHATAGNGFG